MPAEAATSWGAFRFCRLLWCDIVNRNENALAVMLHGNSYAVYNGETGEWLVHLARSADRDARTCGMVSPSMLDFPDSASATRESASSLGAMIIKLRDELSDRPAIERLEGCSFSDVEKNIMSIPQESSTHAVAPTDTEVDEVVHHIKTIQLHWGMVPREDSTLARNFALGLAGPAYKTPFDVAHELVFVNRIYMFTIYGELIEDVMRKVAAQIKKRYRLPWTGTWQIVRFYVPEMLKMHLLRRSGRYQHILRDSLSCKN